MNIKIIAVLLLFFGETIAIFAEVITARNYAENSPFLQLILKGFLLLVIGAGFLISGYVIGFKAFKNIWVVSAISITAILIAEPLIDYSIFRQMPTIGALIGLILGVIGFIFAIFYK